MLPTEDLLYNYFVLISFPTFGKVSRKERASIATVDSVLHRIGNGFRAVRISLRPLLAPDLADFAELTAAQTNIQEFRINLISPRGSLAND